MALAVAGVGAGFVDRARSNESGVTSAKATRSMAATAVAAGLAARATLRARCGAPPMATAGPPRRPPGPRVRATDPPARGGGLPTSMAAGGGPTLGGVAPPPDEAPAGARPCTSFGKLTSAGRPAAESAGAPPACGSERARAAAALAAAAGAWAAGVTLVAEGDMAASAGRRGPSPLLVSTARMASRPPIAPRPLPRSGAICGGPVSISVSPRVAVTSPRLTLANCFSAAALLEAFTGWGVVAPAT